MVVGLFVFFIPENNANSLDENAFYYGHDTTGYTEYIINRFWGVRKETDICSFNFQGLQGAPGLPGVPGPSGPSVSVWGHL